MSEVRLSPAARQDPGQELLHNRGELIRPFDLWHVPRIREDVRLGAGQHRGRRPQVAVREDVVMVAPGHERWNVRLRQGPDQGRPSVRPDAEDGSEIAGDVERCLAVGRPL